MRFMASMTGSALFSALFRAFPARPPGDSKYVLLAGLSGLIASALSMGSGAYLAAKSEREIYMAEVAREREAIEMNGPEARELLSLYYQVKGLPEEDALNMVNHIASDPDQLLRALASERLGSSEDALANPMVSASSGALSTAVGAAIPIIPFFFMHGVPAVIAAAVVSLAAHFAVGAAKSLITVRSWWSSGMEMTIVGAVEGCGYLRHRRPAWPERDVAAGARISARAARRGAALNLDGHGFGQQFLCRPPT